MSKKKSKMGRPPTGQVPQRQIRATDEQWAAYQRAAESKGLTRSEWIRATLDRSAARTGK